MTTENPQPADILATSHLAALCDAFTTAGYPMAFGTGPSQIPGAIGVRSTMSFGLSYTMPTEMLTDADAFAGFRLEVEVPALADRLHQLALDCVRIAAIALEHEIRLRDQPDGWDDYGVDHETVDEFQERAERARELREAADDDELMATISVGDKDEQR